MLGGNFMKKIVNLFFISLMLLSFTTINCSLATTNDETFFVTSNENNDSFSFLMTDISTQETTEAKNSKYIKSSN